MRTAQPTVPPPWQAWLRHHERALAWLTLAVVASGCALLAAPPSRRLLLEGVQRLSDRWDARWDARLARGEALVSAGRFEDAARYLERLDRAWPATSPQHARDQERERVLRLLARSYEGLDRTTRTMATYDRLIAFDPNDYYNVYLKAEAAQRMLSGWAVAVEARDAWTAALQLFPNHLPSLRGVIGYYADRSEYRPIAVAYRTYLEAFLVHRVEFRFGDTTVAVPVPVDGQPHELLLAVPGLRADSVSVHAAGFIVTLERALAMPALTVGRTAPDAPVALTPVAARMERTAQGAWRPVAASAALTLALPPTAVAELRLTLRLFKPVDEALWGVVRQAYRNLLDTDDLAADEARTVPFATEAQADAVLLGLRWARVGLGRMDAQP